ncbi:hypothetical protein F5B17DRAFT_131975 [Nemania serpens]|nr:hypothetical protein F5B17DRAFT_131975 [Nemania serpens]
MLLLWMLDENDADMRARLRTEMAKYHSSFLTVQITTSFGFTRSSTISDYVFLCPNTLTKFAHFYISLNVTPRKTGVKLKTNKILPFSTQSSPDAHSSASNHSTTLYRRPRKIPRKVVSWIRKLYHLVQTYTDLHIDRDTCTELIRQHHSQSTVGYGSQCRHEHQVARCWNRCMAESIPLFVFEFAVTEAICAVFLELGVFP